jgi:hypothetical protein
MLVSAPDETLHRANSEFSLPNSGAAESVVVCINAQPGMRWDGMNNAYSGNFAHYFTISGCETGEALLGGGVRGGFPAVSIVADGPVGPPGAQVWRVHQTRSGNTATPHEQVMANSICHRTPSGMSASTRVVTGAAVTVQAEQFATISAACPPGQKALSGGVAHDTAAGPAATGLMRIIASEPEASGDGWTATVLNLNPPGGPAIASSVSTICAPVTP